MLKQTQSFFTHHLQAVLHSLNALCSKPFATLMTLIVVTVSLALPTFFWVCTDNFNQFAKAWQRGGHISLYLKMAATDDEQASLLKQIKSLQGVGQAVLKSPAMGLDELTQQEGMHDIMRYLPENPLPAMIEVTPALTIDSPTKLDSLAKQLELLPHVELAKLDMEWVSRLHAIFGFVAHITHALIVLLAVAVVLIIGNTLRSMIHNRHEEIQILKLVGASDPFIMRPFLYSGIWYGLVGAILAVLVVNILMLSITNAINRLASAYQMSYPLSGLSIRQILILVFFAIILGWLGALLSVKRQLASIEPLI